MQSNNFSNVIQPKSQMIIENTNSQNENENDTPSNREILQAFAQIKAIREERMHIISELNDLGLYRSNLVEVVNSLRKLSPAEAQQILRNRNLDSFSEDLVNAIQELKQMNRVQLNIFQNLPNALQRFSSFLISLRILKSLSNNEINSLFNVLSTNNVEETIKAIPKNVQLIRNRINSGQLSTKITEIIDLLNDIPDNRLDEFVRLLSENNVLNNIVMQSNMLNFHSRSLIRDSNCFCFN